MSTCIARLQVLGLRSSSQDLLKIFRMPGGTRAIILLRKQEHAWLTCVTVLKECRGACHSLPSDLPRTSNTRRSMMLLRTMGLLGHIVNHKGHISPLLDGSPIATRHPPRQIKRHFNTLRQVGYRT